MIKSNTTMAKQIAHDGETDRASGRCFREETHRTYRALSPAERALAKSPAGAAQVQDFHRQLFTNSADTLRQEIKRITGIEVREATAEVEPTTGTVVQAFTTGTVVQVYLLAGDVPSETWSGNGSPDLS